MIGTQSRIFSHRIMALNQELEVNEYKLDINCTYGKNEETGEKEYHEKLINLIIVQYVNDKAPDGCEIGQANMKTSNFIGQNQTKYTVQMDFERLDRNLYLTMRVSANEIEERDLMFNELYIE